ncbi:MAG TPA: TetR/AcrR family transcriptional regulator [Solirubrobacterales bacterium]|nr:TetR/AcrR family transcriptional regulator [Solirubrobacterales bacterium]
MARLPAHLSNAPVGRKRMSKQELSALQREKILAAAIQVFAKRGYQPTTVENIVNAAGIGVGGFYAHFEGKDDCLLQAYAKIVAEARERIAAAVPADAPWPQQLCTALAELLRAIAAEPAKARIALVEIQTGGESALRRHGETQDEAVALLRAGRELGTADPEPPETFEEATVSGLVWLLQQRVVRGELDDLGDLLGEMAEMILDPYLGTERTRQELQTYFAGAGLERPAAGSPA